MDKETLNQTIAWLDNKIDNQNITIIASKTKKAKANLTIAQRELMIIKYELELFVKMLGE